VFCGGQGSNERTMQKHGKVELYPAFWRDDDLLITNELLYQLSYIG